MKFEYLLFNLIVIMGPFSLSFDKKVNYFRKWHIAFLAIGIVAIPFIVWDALVSGSHWWFNDKFTSNFKLLGLPLGEWLFFVTVPFACLFVWEIITTKKEKAIRSRFFYFRLAVIILLPLGFYLFTVGKEYTGLVMFSFTASLFLDYFLKTCIFSQTKTLIYLTIITALMFIFNGYLTARPVVLYGEEFQLGFRLFTIPIEDFGYGYSLILLNTILYEKFKGLANA